MWLLVTLKVCSNNTTFGKTTHMHNTHTCTHTCTRTGTHAHPTHTHLELALGERLVKDRALEVGAARGELKKKVGGVREKVTLGGCGVKYGQQLCQPTQCG